LFGGDVVGLSAVTHYGTSKSYAPTRNLVTIIESFCDGSLSGLHFQAGIRNQMVVLAVFFTLLTLYENRQLRLMQPHRWGRLLFLASKPIRLSSCSKLCCFIVSNKSSIFCGAVVGVLTETLQDTYLHYKITKEMWDTLNTEYGGSDAGIELYIIEQYHNY
jgi:hypothetical protein